MTLSIADRRTTVRHLAAEGHSARAIATRLGVSKDTIRRDLAALASPTGSGGAAAARATPATEPTTRDPDPANWPQQITLDYDHRLHYDLRYLAAAGLTTPAAAIRWALDHAASALSAEHDQTGRIPQVDPPA